MQLSNARQTGIRNLFVGYESDTRLTGAALKNIINEELTPTELSHPDIVIKPEIYKRLRTFLESRDIPCTTSEKSGRLIPRRAICALFWDTCHQDCGRALSRYDAVKRSEQVVTSSSGSPVGNGVESAPFGHPSPGRSPQPSSLEKQKGNLSKIFASNFKKDSEKFSGALEENWPRYLITYQQVCEEAGVTAQDKLKFLRHVLRDEALEFYYSQVHEAAKKLGFSSRHVE